MELSSKRLSLSPLWPNLVRTSLLADGIKHLVGERETLEDIAHSYQVEVQSILEHSHNQYLRAQLTDGRDNNGDGQIDEAGELAIVEGNTVFIPTGGLKAPVYYGGDAEPRRL